jgi:hypothetical protein
MQNSDEPSTSLPSRGTAESNLFDLAAILEVHHVNEYNRNRIMDSRIWDHILRRPELNNCQKRKIILEAFEDIDYLRYIYDHELEENKKWGFVVYRTTYSDDQKWARFNELFQAGVRKFVTNIEENGDLAHLAYLNFPVRDDKALFDNATIPQLRAHFTDWLKSDDVYDEQGLTREECQDFVAERGTFRHAYFIKVDEDAMENVLNNGTEDGYVNMVWADESYYKDVSSDDDDDDDNNEDEDEDDEKMIEENKEHQKKTVTQDCGLEEIEGSREPHVGFQRITVEHIYPAYWYKMMRLSEDWELIYTRPPRIRGIHD